ncbi:hypothetical protein EX30DRAFT_99869 [Ascodesmis nigricans]|uniref:NADH-ubiquinone oxidoreductase 12 kDa subunit mitochondrial n=1 Tax=Ascodesmis nigricans TaxID=341454 RepID=A0A4S2N4N1_9PEZI|nr:hypothetical protein EX30DRAFT_99869 [Ascodesmis nigricans]
MPIPESKDFLARKPKVPPTFDGVDYSNTKALKAAQDAILREQWISTMENRILKQELAKCYYKEGINHLANCGALRGESMSFFFFLYRRGRLGIVVSLCVRERC